MATVNSYWFTKGGKNLVEAEVSWSAAAVYVALMKSAYVFDQDTPENWGDISANEATGTAYTAGGVAIANKSVVVDAASNETRLMGDNVLWPGSTITSRGAAIYINAGAKPLLGFVDFLTDRVSDAGLFQITWPATGVLRLRAL